jgi:hypothetical protein
VLEVHFYPLVLCLWLGVLAKVIDSLDSADVYQNTENCQHKGTEENLARGALAEGGIFFLNASKAVKVVPLWALTQPGFICTH